jgi:effector-binding domain-containing protein
MPYDVRIGQSPATVLAIVRRRARQGDLAEVVPRAIGEVWDYLRANPAIRPGRNVAVYLDGAIHLECGAEVAEPFQGDGEVACSTLPAGPIAFTEHVGPYNQLHGAHQAVHRFCADRGFEMAGPSWEVYGHWVEAPAELRTEVCYLLRPAGPESTS